MKIISVQIAALLMAPAATLAQTANDVAAQAIQQARNVITDMVKRDSRLTPEFLRLGFHDCVGGCDGCVDLSNPDNNGLARPINMLNPVVQQFANSNTGLSRGDVWAIAAMVGADAADHGITSRPISFNQKWFGRVDCENANSVCLNARGQQVSCSATAGPHRVLPSPTLNSDQVFSYFATNFGFNERQTVTAMGAHTCGRLVKSESGVNGPHGWTINNVKLQNEYYQALMGAATFETPISQIAEFSPNWVRVLEDNSGTGFPNINRWGLDIDDLKLVMLNTDIGLVRDLNATSVNPTTGAVSCTFNGETGSPQCGVRASTARIAAEFSDDNDRWLGEFNTVMDLILTNGYNRLQCQSSVCRLASNRIAPPTPVVSPIPPPTKPPTPPPIAPPPTKPVPQTAPSPYTVTAPSTTVSGWKMTKIGSNGWRVSVGIDGTVAIAGTDYNHMIMVSAMGNYWTQRPGGALDVAVVDSSRMYHIGFDKLVYRWTGSWWNAVGHSTKSISAASDNSVAVVNSNIGTIWVKTGYDDVPNWRQVPYVEGAKRVAIVQYGWLYYIGSDDVIYYTDMVNRPVRVGHSCREISASPDGSVVCVNVLNDIWVHVGGRTDEAWYQVPGKVNVVGVYNGRAFVTADSSGATTWYDRL